jgi:hypothetical protein
VLLVRSLAPAWVAYLDSDWSMALASLARLTTAALEYTFKNGLCIYCGIANCVACSATGVCATCSNVTTFYNAGNACLFCDANCAVCSSNKICQTCSNSSFLPSLIGQCILCTIPNCQTCSIINNCSQCIPGATFFNGSCNLCNLTNCVTCSANNVCGSCESGYVLNNGTCTLSCNVSRCSGCSVADVCSTCNQSFANGTQTVTLFLG